MVFLWCSDIRLSFLELVLCLMKGNSAVRQNTCIEVHSLIACLVLYRYTWRFHRDLVYRGIKSHGKFRYSEYPECLFLGHFSVKLSKLFQIAQFHLKTGFPAFFGFPVYFSIKPPHRSLVYPRGLYWCI